MRVELCFSLAILLTICLLGLCHPTLGDHDHVKFQTGEKNAVITARTTEYRKQREVLEPDGKFVVEWETDLATESITFQVIAETTGFVGFGLSPGGGMEASDIIIGGIFPNGQSYFAVCRCATTQLDIYLTWTESMSALCYPETGIYSPIRLVYILHSLHHTTRAILALSFTFVLRTLLQHHCKHFDSRPRNKCLMYLMGLD